MRQVNQDWELLLQIAEKELASNLLKLKCKTSVHQNYLDLGPSLELLK